MAMARFSGCIVVMCIVSILAHVGVFMPALVILTQEMRHGVGHSEGMIAAMSEEQQGLVQGAEQIEDDEQLGKCLVESMFPESDHIVL